MATLGSRIVRSGSVRDEALERAFARRDADAYETAYRRFGGRLYATALRVLGSPALAQDCVHDVLLHLWQRGNSYAPDRGSLEAFLTVCVRNGALARIRTDNRQSELRGRLVQEEPAVPENDPIERQRIARAIAGLTPLQAQMIDYAYYRAMTLSEIATETQKPLGTVKSHISAALRALRKTLQDKDVQ